MNLLANFILFLEYPYLIWKKRDISFEDILLLPLLKKLGLFCKTTEAISVRKKLFYNVGGLLVSMVVVFLIILLSAKDVNSLPTC